MPLFRKVLVQMAKKLSLGENIFAVFLVLNSGSALLAQTVNDTPELVLQMGHTAGVSTLDISPDGRTIVSGGMDNAVKLWDTKTGLLKRTLRVDDWVESVAFSPRGDLVASGGGSPFSSFGDLRLWRASTGEQVARLEGHTSGVGTVAFSPDGERLLSGSFDGTAKLWDVKSGTLIRTLEPHVSLVHAAAFSPDGRTVAIGSGTNKKSGEIKLWDATTGKVLQSITDYSDWVEELSFSPDGRTLAVGSKDHTLRLWDVATGRLVWSVMPRSGDQVVLVLFLPDGKNIAVGTSNTDEQATDYGVLQLREARTGSLVRTLFNSWAGIVAFSRDGRTMVSSSGSDIQVRNATTNEVETTFAGNRSSFASIAFTPDGGSLVSVGRREAQGEIRFWDTKTGQLKRVVDTDKFKARVVAVSPDGKSFAVGGGDDSSGEIQLRDLQTAKVTKVLTGHRAAVTSVDFSPDSLLLTSGSDDNSVRLWNVESGRELWHTSRQMGHKAEVSDVTFSPTGTIIATAGTADNTARLWNASGELVELLIGQTGVFAVAFSPDGKTLATGTGVVFQTGETMLWNVASKQMNAELTGHNSFVGSLAYSPDGRNLASGSWDGTIRLWDTQTSQLKHVLTGHDGMVSKICFSPDGRMLASAGLDNTVRLWSVERGEMVVAMIGENEGSWMNYTPDGYYRAARGAHRAIGFRVGDQVFPFDQFDLKLNRPDIVLERLGRSEPAVIRAYRNAYLKRLSKAGFTEAMLGTDFHVPEISIATQPLSTSTSSKTVKLKVVGFDDRYLLERLNVFINDVPIYGARGSSLKGQKTKKIEMELELELSNGKNKIQVSVLNEKGAESLKQNVTLNYDGPPTKPNLYVVTIGVSKYANSRYNLTYADKDAQDVADFLVSKKENFASVVALSLLNENATRAKILKLKEHLMRSGVDDEVVLFLAGHGMLDRNLEYYFGTTDIDFAHPAQRGLSYNELEDLLEGIPARKKLLLMDTCHSGEIDQEETKLVAVGEVNDEQKSSVKQRRFPRAELLGLKPVGLSNSYDLLKELFTDLRRGSGTIVVSAASGVEFAYEASEWKNGVFTFALLEGLRTGQADLDKNNEIDVSELRDYVIGRVQRLTEGKQKPTMRREALDNDFRIF